jgi:hypothetical protein
MIVSHNNMSLPDITMLIELVQRVQPVSILEIGVNEGCTARQILDNVTSIESYTGVDLSDRGKHSEYLTHNAHIVPPMPAKEVWANPKFRLILKPHGSFDLTAQELGPYDVVFIDGDHMLWGIMHDTGLAKRIAKKLIIWHDYLDLEAKPFVDCLRSYLSIVHIPGTTLAYSKV